MGWQWKCGWLSIVCAHDKYSAPCLGHSVITGIKDAPFHRIPDIFERFEDNFRLSGKNVPFAANKVIDHFSKAIETAREIGAKGLEGLACLNHDPLHNVKKRIGSHGNVWRLLDFLKGAKLKNTSNLQRRL